MSDAAPETHYARTADGVHVAYQVAGDGPLDLLVVSSSLGLGTIWKRSLAATFPHKYVSFARLILLDRRGTGLSDHNVGHEQLTLEAQMDDIRAVLDAVGTERAVLLGFETGFMIAAMFAATYPERVTGLIAYGAQARVLWAPDYPWGRSLAQSDAEIADVEARWGTRALAEEWNAGLDPRGSRDETAVTAFVDWMQSLGGPGDAARWERVDRELDLREVLPTIRVPTLVLHRRDDPEVSVEHGRYLAAHIPGAEFQEMPGDTHTWSRSDDLPAAVAAFVGRLHEEQVELDRYLATVLFTDIVASTSIAAAAGDAAWRALVEDHHRLVRGALARYRGTEMDTAGDGFFAAFDGPARAIRCALQIVEGVRDLGIEIRVGIHTGEVQLIDGKPGGIAATLGARIMGVAGASEVLVSQTVKDLTAGSGLSFEDAGEHELKGVPDRWRLYRVVS